MSHQQVRTSFFFTASIVTVIGIGAFLFAFLGPDSVTENPSSEATAQEPAETPAAPTMPEGWQNLSLSNSAIRIASSLN